MGPVLRSLICLAALASGLVLMTACVDRDAPPGTTRYNRGQVIAIANSSNRYHDRWWGDPIQVQRPQRSGPDLATTHWTLVYKDLDGTEQLIRVNAHTAWVHQPVLLPPAAEPTIETAVPGDTPTAHVGGETAAEDIPGDSSAASGSAEPTSADSPTP